MTRVTKLVVSQTSAIMTEKITTCVSPSHDTADGSDSRPAQCSSQLTDRKSTRLNSSHDQISYAVFCLKKKKKPKAARNKKDDERRCEMWTRVVYAQADLSKLSLREWPTLIADRRNRAIHSLQRPVPADQRTA